MQADVADDEALTPPPTPVMAAMRPIPLAPTAPQTLPIIDDEEVLVLLPTLAKFKMLFVIVVAVVGLVERLSKPRNSAVNAMGSAMKIKMGNIFMKHYQIGKHTQKDILLPMSKEAVGGGAKSKNITVLSI